MLRCASLLLPVFLFLCAGCRSSDAPPPTVVDDDASEVDEAITGPEGELDDIVSATGTIRYIDLEGGFYGIETQDGERYNPLNLEDEFREDGLTVRFRGRVRDDVVTIQMWGTPIEVEEMMRVDAMDGP